MKNLYKTTLITGIALFISACTAPVGISAQDITANDTTAIAEIRQDTLENKMSNEKVSWKSGDFKGNMVVIRSYERSDGQYCRRIVESKSQSLTKSVNITSTWCRTGTGDTKWVYYQ